MISTSLRTSKNYINHLLKSIVHIHTDKGKDKHLEFSLGAFLFTKCHIIMVTGGWRWVFVVLFVLGTMLSI